jgi:hypothetical protein
MQRSHWDSLIVGWKATFWVWAHKYTQTKPRYCEGPFCRLYKPLFGLDITFKFIHTPKLLTPYSGWIHQYQFTHRQIYGIGEPHFVNWRPTAKFIPTQNSIFLKYQYYMSILLSPTYPLTSPSTHPTPPHPTHPLISDSHCYAYFPLRTHPSHCTLYPHACIPICTAMDSLEEHRELDRYFCATGHLGVYDSWKIRVWGVQHNFLCQ